MSSSKPDLAYGCHLLNGLVSVLIVLVAFVAVGLVDPTGVGLVVVVPLMVIFFLLACWGVLLALLNLSRWTLVVLGVLLVGVLTFFLFDLETWGLSTFITYAVLSLFFSIRWFFFERKKLV